MDDPKRKWRLKRLSNKKRLFYFLRAVIWRTLFFIFLSVWHYLPLLVLLSVIRLQQVCMLSSALHCVGVGVGLPLVLSTYDVSYACVTVLFFLVCVCTDMCFVNMRAGVFPYVFVDRIIRMNCELMVVSLYLQGKFRGGRIIFAYAYHLSLQYLS